MSKSADQLRSLKTFDHLIRYLEDELEWPLQEYEFDELTFEYQPAELGLKDEDAVKIRRIHQLRPLEHGQPWGIFFVEFEKKKLPVVVLRRILSHLVVKKRADASKAKAAAWDASDILFVSAFGNEASDQRETAFAHFHQESGDLPTLRVLGWDGSDTPLKLDYVDATLKSRLRWPDDPTDHAAWREQWSRAFRHRIGHVIRTADAMAVKLAELARGIRGAAQTMIRHESERGQLRRLYRAFQTALIHDLTEEDFADTYAQTITYGLLTAAISRPGMGEGRHGNSLIADNVADIVPVTNPFLKEMLQTFLKLGGRKGQIDFDELGIQDVVDLLRGEETDLPAILRDFGNKTRGEDPVIHFYEHFLAAYNKRLKVQRGVFYTPQPVVSYIVRSVHELLQTQFGLEDGLADTTTWGDFVAREQSRSSQSDIRVPEGVAPDSAFVQILDPATGTATFLVEVIDVIHRTLTDKWTKQGLNEARRRAAWNEYVPKHLLPRLHGYELMMAPYAIAHMKLPLKLKETEFTGWSKLDDNDRARVYLTNALEQPIDEKKQMEFAEWAPALAHEAAAVNEIKRRKCFTVVIGNPPYAGISSNMTEYAQRLIDAYKIVDGGALNERKLWLQDDYVKFIRKAQMTIERTGLGILGYITNHGYLDNPTFRGMRQSLMGTFSRLRVLDLHGNANKKEQAPDGSEDKNVFDIRQGVAICLASCVHADTAVSHIDVWGSRESKYEWLSKHCGSDTEFSALAPDSPFYFFKPQNTDRRAEYASYWKVTDVFPTNGVGVVMARDSMTVDFDADVLWRRVRDFASLPPEQARTKYGLGDDARDWRVATAQADIRASGPNKKRICSIAYRPFDVRFTYYTGNSRGFYASPCRKVMSNMVGGNNKGLALSRSIEIGRFEHVFCTKGIIGHHSVSLKEVNYLCPLWIEPTEDAPKRLLKEDNERQPNLAPTFLRALSTTLSLKQAGEYGLPAGLTPEDIFHYAYAVLHSPGYRNHYAEFLKKDFPRLPLTGELDLFRALARIGGELVGLHLVEFVLKGEANIPAESPRYPQLVSFTGSDRIIEKFPAANKAWKDGRVAINAGSGFDGMPEDVWNFHIGGYQVCHRWLKDRKGRTLTDEDILHYCKIVTALNETIHLMRQIDKVINEHGGWPGAFTSPAETEQDGQLPFE